MSRVLRHLPLLSSLDVSATAANDDGAAAIADALQPAGACPALRTLRLIGCSIKASGARALTQLVRTYPALEELALGWNTEIRGNAARELADAVLGANQLKRFSEVPLDLLRSGRLPKVPPLSERDKRRRPEVDPRAELHLQGYGMGPAGAHVVAALLPRLPPLLAVVMPYQDLGDDGAEAIAAAAAKSCPKLSFLMLSRNDVSVAAANRVRELLPDLSDFELRINNRGG